MKVIFKELILQKRDYILCEDFFNINYLFEEETEGPEKVEKWSPDKGADEPTKKMISNAKRILTAIESGKDVKKITLEGFEYLKILMDAYLNNDVDDGLLDELSEKMIDQINAILKTFEKINKDDEFKDNLLKFKNGIEKQEPLHKEKQAKEQQLKNKEYKEKESLERAKDGYVVDKNGEVLEPGKI